MEIEDIFAAADADLLHMSCDSRGKPVRHVVACDLMSDVLVVDEDDLLLVTSLASDQSVRTAHVIGAVGVLVVNGKRLPESMVALADDLDVTLARSDLTKFRACIRIGKLLGES